MYKEIILICAAIALVQSNSVFVGQLYDQTGLVRKVYDKMVESTAVPLIRREEEIFYEYPAGDQRIKGIAIRDLADSKAEPSITRGGLGFGFVNIKLKGERGAGLKFMIEIFA